MDMNDILEYDMMVYKIASKYKNSFELDDLVQVGRMGLAKAYKNFDNSFDTKFSTYAYTYILGEILNYIRNSRVVKVSKEMQSLYRNILKTKDKLTNMLGYEASNYEISVYLEIDEKIVDDAILANQYVKSLDYSLNDEDEDKNVNLYDTVSFYENGYNPEILDLKDELCNLSDEEKKIIYFRYYQGLSQSEVGDMLDRNQVSISRSEAKILKKLKDKLAS